MARRAVRGAAQQSRECSCHDSLLNESKILLVPISLPHPLAGVILGFDMKVLGLVDSHIHLTDFETGTDIHALIERAAAAGVGCLVCNGTSEDDWAEVREVALADSRVVPCFGVHPWYTPRRSDEWLSVLEEFLLSMPSGVGEIGLDRNEQPCDREAQEEAFRAQLDVARRLRRPAMVHCVKAWGWLIDILRSEPVLPCGMLVHSYGGSADLIKPLADMGAYFSFSGKVLDGNFLRARAALLAVPRDRLLVETDAPALMPPPEYRSEVVLTSDKREHNSPVNLPDILRGVAELLGERIDTLHEIVVENAARFLEPILEI